MGRFDDLDPSISADLFAADLLTDGGGEDFRAAARHGIEPGVLKLPENFVERKARYLGEKVDLDGRKGLEMNARTDALEPPQDVEIVVERKVGMEAADHVELQHVRTRIARLGFDLLEGEGVAVVVEEPAAVGSRTCIGGRRCWWD